MAPLVQHPPWLQEQIQQHLKAPTKNIGQRATRRKQWRHWRDISAKELYGICSHSVGQSSNSTNNCPSREKRDSLFPTYERDSRHPRGGDITSFVGTTLSFVASTALAYAKAWFLQSPSIALSVSSRRGSAWPYRVAPFAPSPPPRPQWSQRVPRPPPLPLLSLAGPKDSSAEALKALPQQAASSSSHQTPPSPAHAQRAAFLNRNRHHCGAAGRRRSKLVATQQLLRFRRNLLQD